MSDIGQMDIPKIDAQKRAGDPATSAWVSAAAGTGKTRVLRDRVLRLMLAGTPPARILCLTYTKAAAAEMANRINDALTAWVRMADEDLAADLADIGVTRPTPETLSTARRLFADVLETPGGMKIQTIHSFCQSVLGRFPLEAHMAPHFTLMEEQTARELQRDALDHIFAELGTTSQPALSEAVGYLARQCSDFALGELMNALFAERSKLQTLWEASNRPGAPDIDRGLARRLGFERPPDTDAILRAAVADGAFDHVNLRRICRAQLEGKATDQKNGQRIADWLAADGDGRAQSFTAYCGAFLTQKGEIAKKLATKAICDALPDAPDILSREAERLKAVCETLNSAEVWAASSALHRLGERVVGRYDVLKTRQALMDYWDLILRTQRLLAAPDIAPWVLYKLDGGIDHILVDEAQDTSPEQWRIIEHLVAEFFTGRSARETDRTVFAVGDVQQSIYGFQGAAPREFETYRKIFGERAADAGRPFRTETLNLTYRTAQPVLDVVNVVFNQDNRTTRRDAPGLVELWPVECKQAAEEKTETWTPPLTQFEVDDPAARCAHHVAERIANWLETGERLSEKKAVSPGDIMILVRRRNEFVGHMIRELKKRGIPVAGADRMVLMEQLVVMDLCAAAAFALLPEDDLTLACVLKGPLINLSEDDLFALAHRRKGTLWDALRRRREEMPAFAAAHDLLTDLLNAADRMPPFEFFSHILTAHDGRRRLVARLGTQAIDPLEEFLSLALQFEHAHTPSLQDFLHWLDSSSFEIQRASDSQRDEVRVMTVHGAKGLEAPIVFLADTCGVPQKKSRLLWMDSAEEGPLMIWPPKKDLLAGDALAAYEARDADDMAEYDRLLYVAMTRARDRLYVTGFERKKRTPDCWYERIRAGLDRLGDAVTREERDEAEILRYGDSGQFPAVAAPEQTSRAAEPSAPAWLTAPPPAEPTPPRPLAPSQPDEEEPPVITPGRGAQDRFRRGRIMHRLLELLPDLPAERRRPAGERFLAQQRPALSAADQASYLDEVLAIIESPAHAAYFGPHSAAEVPIVGLFDGHPVAGQVDRLAVTEDAVYVIDYKTNRPAPMTLDAVPAVYHRQMAAYRRILTEIYPQKRVLCALLWTEGPKLLQLPDG